MRLKEELRQSIIDAIAKAGAQGATITELEGMVDLERHTLSKYLHLMKSKGLVNFNKVGKAKLWMLDEAPLETIFKTPEHKKTFSEKVLSDIISGSPIAIFVIDNFYKVQFLNSLAREKFGEMTDKTFYGDVMGLKNPLPLGLGELFDKNTKRVARTVKDSSGNTYNMQASALINPKGKLSLIVMLEDITAQIRLEETTKRLAAIVEHSDDAIISKDLDGTILSWNKGAQRIFGYTAEEIVGKSIMTLVPKEREEEEENILETVSSGKKIQALETVRQCKDGSHIHISVTVSPIKNSSGQVKGLSSIKRDITERKHQEKKLMEQHAKIEQLVTNNPDIIMRFNRDGKISYVNPKIEVLSQNAPSYYIGKGVGDLELPARVAEKVEKDMEKAFAGEQHTAQYRLGDDEANYLQTRWIPEYEEGKVVSVFSVSRDVTESRTYERKLEESHMKLRLALKAGDIGTWEWNMRSDDVLWSPELERMHGLEEGSFGGSFHHFHQDIHPEDKERVLKLIEKTVAEKQPYLTEYRIVLPDGAVRHIHARGSLILDASGEPVKMMGVCMQTNK